MHPYNKGEKSLNQLYRALLNQLHIYRLVVQLVPDEACDYLGKK